MLKEIEKGQYKVPEGMVATLSNGVITVRESKKQMVIGDRCKDCKHFASGHSTHPRWTTTVCLEKPKRVEHGVQLYYHVQALGKICECFDKKED